MKIGNTLGQSWGKTELNSTLIYWVHSFDWILKWGRKWEPIPVFLPGESNGQRSLVGYSSWDRKESDTTERLHSLTHSGANSFIIVSWPAQSVYSPSPFGSVQSLSHVRLFGTPWIAARQTSLSITNSRSSLKLMSNQILSMQKLYLS